MTSNIDWDAIRHKLPTDKTGEARAKRTELFSQFDPNGNGYLSLAEVDRGCRDVLGLYELFECKKVIMRAFQAAKGANDAKESSDDPGRDYVQKVEFRLLLVYLKQYFEIWHIFASIDSGRDHRIDFDEFSTALPKLEALGLTFDDPKAAFDEIDTNGGGQILFDEFADWAIQKSLPKETE